ncbi:LacI family transcriptional regulator [Polynucleobacter tropicus]|uniref:LacI family transcriptional regulator n=1 Tax=Polynucleobacter tropicus TaxID=1743174 RepID=A0A6M9Q0T9_9BURK|nr:tripartite tricarboxylate transporter substrate binding protein [Polynucleobacter tropicus]QKM65238.1 LacI family transcriptional regulator [Polynucleobacter tropicus]
MKLLLRQVFSLCTIFFLGTIQFVSAQGYPDKSIRLMVGYAPGGLTDGVARTLAPQLTEILGKQVVVENRGGGGSSIATDVVAKAPADGYTLLMADQALISNPSLFPALPYDTLKDLMPVALVGTAASVIVVNASVPVRDLKSLIALAKSKPGTLNYASGGNGTMTHLAGELFKQVARVDIVHVPYKGTGPAVVDLLGGQVPMMFSSIGPVAQYIKSGQLIALAVTGDSRSPALPNIPTLSELGLAQATVIGYWGVMTPTGTPNDVVEKLAKSIAEAVKRPDVNQRLVNLGIDPSFVVGARYEKILNAEIPKWAQVIKQANIRID